jgi:TonB-linked SusC/RagA family outer membrane protein
MKNNHLLSVHLILYAYRSGISKIKQILIVILFAFMPLTNINAGVPSNLIEISQQQEKQISGKVIDINGDPIPGVNVVIKGTTKGVATASDGTFSVIVPKENSVLVFSFIGYMIHEVPVEDQTEINLTMMEDALEINEVVITGYGGTQLRSKLTNSISKVKEETFQGGVYSNPAQALSGAVSGLRVIKTSGNPLESPRIVLRGGTNLDGSGSPLILVDGQVRWSWDDINPEDIESMEVMKDAGATALYGARANNGVILITTKSGKSGSSEVKVSAKVGINYLKSPYEPLSARDYIYWLRKGVQNASQIWKDKSGKWIGYYDMSSLATAQPYGTGNLYFDPKNPTVPLNGNYDSRAIWSPMLLDNTNKFLLSEGWETMIDPIYGDEIIFKEFDYLKAGFNTPSISQDYNISISGGNEKGHYYTGIGYNHSEGHPLETFYKRVNGIFNGDYKIKPWFTSYSNINFSTANYKNGLGLTDQSNLFFRYLTAPPTLRGNNSNGEPLVGRGGGDGNPLAYINIFDRDLNRTNLSIGQSFKFDLMKGLYVKASALYLYRESFNENFNKDYMSSPNVWNRTRSSSASFSRELMQTYNIVANYDVTIANNHTLSVLAGAESYDNYARGFSASGSGAPTDDFKDLGLTSSKENKRAIDSNHARNRILSFMGRINYDYQDKYLLSAVFRRDGYSILQDNRWGFFPGISAGWVFNKEDFMYDLRDIVSFAKLRASYGVNGSVSGVSDYELQGVYGTTRYNGTVGYNLSTVPNPGLLWEKSNTFEFGLDLGLLENVINANVVFYDRTTEDKFANIPLPGSSGITGIRSNNGVLNNRGVEIELGYKILRSKDWKWDLNGNISYYKNKIISLPDNGLERNRQGAIQVYSGNGDELIWVGGYQEGQRPGDIYVFQANGLFKTDEELQRIAPDRVDKTISRWNQGRPLYGPDAWAALTEEEKKLAHPIQPGDVNWKDINGDGMIDVYDKVYVGNREPKWFGGLTNTISWKGLTFLARLDYALGHYQTDYAAIWIMGCMQGSFNSIAQTKDSWTPDNINAKYPKYYWADQDGKRNYERASSMFTYNASYLSFRELSLTYDFAQKWMNTAGISSLQLSISGQNLGYLSKSKMYSPEVGGEQIQSGYTLPRSVIFGVSLTF